jgi:DNA-binding XRE family transcriptional regulator
LFTRACLKAGVLTTQIKVCALSWSVMKTFRLGGPAVITNERQYAVAQAELQRFEKAAAGRQEQAPAAGIDPHIEEAMVDSLRGQAETLRKEVKRYEGLRDGRIGRRELGSLRDFPTALIEARIVAGLTQRQVGERLEVKEQQIQHWEANLYSGVGVERLQEVADALGMKVKETVSYAATAPPG